MAATGQIDYVEFPAIDIVKTKKFYSDAFAWKFEDYGSDYTSFTDGRLAGGFYLDPHAATQRPLVVIYAENLEALEAKVKSAGGHIVKPVLSFPGGRRFHFTDPNGNELAVWSDRSPSL